MIGADPEFADLRVGQFSRRDPALRPGVNWRTWILDEPFAYHDAELGVIVMPKGMRSDLTTGWFEGRWTAASLVHDYVLGEYVAAGCCTRREAGLAFRRAQRSAGCGPKRSEARRLGTRLGDLWAWVRGG